MTSFPDEKIYYRMSKNVAFFVRNLTDEVISIAGQSYGGITVTDLANQSQAFWIQSGSDNIPDLCTSISANIQYITGVFNDGKGDYQLNSVDFFGGHPVSRPK